MRYINMPSDETVTLPDGRTVRVMDSRKADFGPAGAQMICEHALPDGRTVVEVAPNAAGRWRNAFFFRGRS